MSSTIRSTRTPKACCARFRGSARAPRARRSGAGCTPSKAWCRTYFICRKAARSRRAATRERWSVLAPRFRWRRFKNTERSVAFMPEAAEPLLSVQHLKKYFPIHRGVLGRVAAHVKAVDDVSFTINKGETFGLVG